MTDRRYRLSIPSKIVPEDGPGYIGDALYFFLAGLEEETPEVVGSFRENPTSAPQAYSQSVETQNPVLTQELQIDTVPQQKARDSSTLVLLIRSRSYATMTAPQHEISDLFSPDSSGTSIEALTLSPTQNFIFPGRAGILEIVFNGQGFAITVDPKGDGNKTVLKTPGEQFRIEVTERLAIGYTQIPTEGEVFQVFFRIL